MKIFQIKMMRTNHLAAILTAIPVVLLTSFLSLMATQGLLALLFLIATYAWIRSPNGEAVVLTEEEVEELEREEM